jgi:nucleoside 2-deoxyribosyltransferase
MSCQTTCQIIKICPVIRVYVAGPNFNNAEKTEQLCIATILEKNGFKTYLPQRDGLDLNRVVNKLIAEGRTREQAEAEAPRLVFQFDVYNLMKTQIIVSNMNYCEPDPGTVSMTAIAYASCMPVLIYRDDIRVFTPVAEMDPHVSSLTTFPIVRKRRDIACAVRDALPKKDAKCISEAVRETMTAGAAIIPGRFKDKKCVPKRTCGA